MAFPPLFLSYASDDIGHAQGVHDRLTAAGFDVWFDKVRLAPGFQWYKEIEAACNAARVVLPVLTPRWKISEWTRYETYGAENVIPLIVEGDFMDVATPPLIRYQNSAIALADDKAWQQLFTSIRDLLNQPAPTPEDRNRVVMLSHHKIDHFVGREDKLTELLEKLFTNPTAALTQAGHIQAVTALGGVGKTTLARHYADRYWRLYQRIFWVDCRAGVEAGFARIHDKLRDGPEFAALPNDVKARWARSKLDDKERPDSLLILDNAENEESVTAWIPKSGNCHTLITSRFTAWSGGIGKCEVWVLTAGPARELLLKRAGLSDVAAEIEPADAVASKLEYLPLALEQAAAYVAAQTGLGFAGYLRLYGENERRFLERKTPGATDYPDSVYLTWQATVAKLPQGARAMLRLHAFVASTPFPLDLYIAGAAMVVEEAKRLAEQAGAATDVDLVDAGELTVRDWFAALSSYSMVTVQAGGSFSVHSLVQAVQRYEIGVAQAETLGRMTDLMVANAPWPSWVAESRERWDILLAHAESLCERVWTLGVGGNPDLLDQIACAYKCRGDYQRAIPAQRKDLEIRERVLGKEHPETLTSVSNLAGLLDSQGDYEQAELLYRRALNTCEEMLGEDHPDTLKTVNNLAVLLGHRGKFAEAEPLLRQSVEISERVLGIAHPDTLRATNNLAVLLDNQGNYAGLEALFRRTLETQERVLGKEHPATIASVSNLGGLLVRKGDHRQAEVLLRRALEASERVFGKEHPTTLTSIAKLARLSYSRGDHSQSEPLYRHALQSSERVLGREHPNTLTLVNDLAVSLEGQGKFADAELLYRRALETSERVLGKMHPKTLISVNNLAGLLDNKCEYSRAEPLYRRALEGLSEVLGPDHPNTKIAARNLAGVLQLLRH